MPIWRNVIKGVIKASLPTIIVPATFVGVIIKYFGLSLDSLLAIIFFGQLYIIWAQLEVALRQTRLSMLEYEPELMIEAKEPLGVSIGREAHSFEIQVVNTGKHLARNVLISMNVEGENEKDNFFIYTNIAPNERIPLRTFDEQTFKNNRIVVHIDYDNMLGDFGGISFSKGQGETVFIVSGHKRMPGILLNSLEDLALISHVLTLSYRIKRYRKKLEK